VLVEAVGNKKEYGVALLENIIKGLGGIDFVRSPGMWACMVLMDILKFLPAVE